MLTTYTQIRIVNIREIVLRKVFRYCSHLYDRSTEQRKFDNDIPFSFPKLYNGTPLLPIGTKERDATINIPTFLTQITTDII